MHCARYGVRGGHVCDDLLLCKLFTLLGLLPHLHRIGCVPFCCCIFPYFINLPSRSAFIKRLLSPKHCLFAGQILSCACSGLCALLVISNFLGIGLHLSGCAFSLLFTLLLRFASCLFSFLQIVILCSQALSRRDLVRVISNLRRRHSGFCYCPLAFILYLQELILLFKVQD
ncbi:Uncharacterised protein [Enterobacter hormaechei]|nr:Uncharacterised protein [Enterobacter hormaechei]